MCTSSKWLALLCVVALAAAPSAQRGPAAAQTDALRPAPPRRADEGKVPFKTMVIRGATLIDGTGGPAGGPVDIVVEGNRIASIRNAGTPGLPLPQGRAPERADLEVDAAGMYVLPGFVDMHVHG